MPFLMLEKNCFSDKVGGGDITGDVGIGRNPMIGAGLIIMVIHLGIEAYLVIGEIISILRHSRRYCDCWPLKGA